MKKKIVIIGAGLAGLSAALQTSENGNKVVLVSAYPSERAQSVHGSGWHQCCFEHQRRG